MLCPVPLAIDLLIDQVEAPWPPPGVPPVQALNSALSARVGPRGWPFEWESRTEKGAWRVSALLAKVSVHRCPEPGDGVQAVVEAQALMRTTVVPAPGEQGDVGQVIADRLEGTVWRYRTGKRWGAALIGVAGVRVADPLREPVQLFGTGPNTADVKSHDLVSG